MRQLIQNAAPRQDGAEIGVESARTVCKCGNENCSLSWHLDVESFDMTKLCNQTLLQSTFAETLRLYVSVCLTRRPEFAEAQILDYRIPKDKLIVISTALAHMDERNWNLGPMEGHPVESFWAGRFLTYNSPGARQTSPASSS